MTVNVSLSACRLGENWEGIARDTNLVVGAIIVIYKGGTGRGEYKRGIIVQYS